MLKINFNKEKNIGKILKVIFKEIREQRWGRVEKEDLIKRITERLNLKDYKEEEKEEEKSGGDEEKEEEKSGGGKTHKESIEEEKDEEEEKE